ncbi:serine hydrolase domain-containing protein [Bifidobacterium biavatii]|uniref:Beta-lactamase n=1 Tax=Bifidobacterium biavatii DSM 23969 TaxID=1437608 RepID=A0A086ZNG4_9BIFI|nr:serine hydrolase domain-containing protein [Bifidobacterium biavatii]KFI48064.1 beta-lactamase [Bifidobacterium biavatii DSM 23969]
MADAQQLIQDALDRAVDRGEVAGANMLAIQHGEERWYAETGARGITVPRPMTRDTIFRLYSQTKPITGTAAMILVERGLIDLAQPVSDFLPGFKGQRVTTEFVPGGRVAGAAGAGVAVHDRDGQPDGETAFLTNDIPTDMAGTIGSVAGDGERTVPLERDLTVKDLLTMTSGLPYPDPQFEAGRLVGKVFDELGARLHGDDPMDTVELANRLGGCPLRFQPGSHWMYGTSADVVGAIVEVVSGKRFGDFLHDEIFEPLGMRDTAFYVPAGKLDRLAEIADSPDFPIDPTNAGKPLREIVTDHLGVAYAATSDPAYQAGGAGLKSTIDDYARFARMLLNGGELDGVRILQPLTVRTMTSGALFARHYPDYEGWQPGCSYNTFMRIVEEPGKSLMLSHRGEYGWDGWLGTYFCNDPAADATFLFNIQLANAGTVPLTRKVKNIVNTHLE